MSELRFWAEQYRLQAFLTFNFEFEVLLANSYLSHYHTEDLKATFPRLPSWRGGQFLDPAQASRQVNEPD